MSGEPDESQRQQPKRMNGAASLTAQPEPQLMDSPPDRLQEKMMACIIWHKAIAREIVEKVPLQLWDSGVQDIVRPCYAFIKKYGRGPGPEHLLDKLIPDNGKSDPDRARFLQHVLLEASRVNNELNIQWVRDWLKFYIQFQQMKTTTIEIASMMQRAPNDPEVVDRACTLWQERVVERQETSSDYRLISSRDLRSNPVPPREYILEPILSLKSANILHGWRGCGKTWLAMGFAWAAATGTSFLDFKCRRKYRVMYVDGELPYEDLLARDRAFHEVFGGVGSRIEYFAYDNQPKGMPDLGTEQGQRELQHLIDHCDPDLIIIDSIDTLIGSEERNQPEGWFTVQQWELKQRKDGRCVLLLGHHNKQDKLNGSYFIENILDYSIGLHAAKGEPPKDMMRFEVRLEKHRRMSEADAKPFIVEFPLRKTNSRWVTGGGSRWMTASRNVSSACTRRVTTACRLPKRRSYRRVPFHIICDNCGHCVGYPT